MDNRRGHVRAGAGACVQGALVGCLSGILVNIWISVGRMTMNIQYPTLPLAAVDRCPAAVANDSLLWQQRSDLTTAAAATQSYHVTTQVCTTNTRFTERIGAEFIYKAMVIATAPGERLLI